MHVRRLWALICVACCPAAALAALDPTDVLQFRANVGLSRDSNLFRLPDADPRLFGIDPANKSDTALIKGVGLKVDKLLSRQRLIADINLNETTYDKNTNLDHFGGDGRLAWLWQVGNHWSGEASARKRRQLAGFGDLQRNVQDLIDTDTYTLTGGYQFHPRWRIAGELGEQETAHNATTRRSLDANSKTTGLSMTYRTPADNSIGLQGRRTDRSYPNRTTVGFVTFDNNHTEDRINLTGVWRPSEIFRLDGRVGHVEVSHEQLSARNFSDITWRVGATWDATSKFRLNVNSSKDVYLYEDIATSYLIVSSIGIAPIYSISTKLVLQEEFTYQNRDFGGDPGFLLVPRDREDKQRTARVALSYQPWRNIDLSLSYEAGERRSNQPINSFDYRSWFGSVRVGF